MTTDTVFAIFSCTKAITAWRSSNSWRVVSLDHPAKEYAPEISDIRVLEGFDADGEPRLRPPASDITVEQLLLRGFGYDFFNEDLVKYGEKRNVASSRLRWHRSIRVYCSILASSGSTAQHRLGRQGRRRGQGQATR